ncbi:MAG: hypothetical protein FWH03_00500 [Firmicutes bacterium]|nr:hypothetical protein [Bacillota bacterium]
MHSKKTRILSIVAVVFMCLFAVSLIIFFIKYDLGGPTIGIITASTGIIGFGLFFIVRGLTRNKNHIVTELSDDPLPDETTENENENETAQNDGSDTPIT